VNARPKITGDKWVCIYVCKSRSPILLHLLLHPNLENDNATGTGQDQVLGFLLLGAISDSLSRLAGTLALQDVVAALEGERPREPAWGIADEKKKE